MDRGASGGIKMTPQQMNKFVETLRIITSGSKKIRLFLKLSETPEFEIEGIDQVNTETGIYKAKKLNQAETLYFGSSNVVYVACADFEKEPMVIEPKKTAVAAPKTEKSK
jgi:hypothetical protein